MTPDTITVWWCDQCGYWRKDKTTGVHQTNDPDDWRGRMVVHELREREFLAVDGPTSSGASEEENTMSETTETIIVMRVLNDSGKPWWEAMGLPDPARWFMSDTFGADVLPQIDYEGFIDRERIP